MIRPRVVIDTNVLVSAGIKSGSAEEAVLFLIADRKLQQFVSRAVLAEYESVLHRAKLNLDPERVDFLLNIGLQATLTNPSVRLFVSPDESDNRFLECAEAAEADYLVTGNKRHFPARWKHTEIVNARELHARLGSQ